MTQPASVEMPADREDRLPTCSGDWDDIFRVGRLVLWHHGNRHSTGIVSAVWWPGAVRHLLFQLSELLTTRAHRRHTRIHRSGLAELNHLRQAEVLPKV